MTRKENLIARIRSYIPRWLSIPFIIFIVFMILLIFFGDYNFMRMSQYNDQIRELKTEIQANEDSTVIFEHRIRELNTDPETLEKIAREKYGMKRPNEDIYITETP